MKKQTTFISLISGGVWGLIALFLGFLGIEFIWIGVVISPLIGFLMGWLARRFASTSLLIQILYSLLALYVATGLFGVSVGVYTGFVHPPLSARIIELTLCTWWGITFTGYLLFLWPLAYANHRLIWDKYLTHQPKT
jgi:hypothetical protein